MDAQQLAQHQLKTTLQDISTRVRNMELAFNRSAVIEKPGAWTAGSVLFAGTSGKIAQDNANFFYDDTNNRLGLGIATPATKLALKGTDVSYGAGPHIETITSADIYPLMQLLSYQHDNINLSFDAYYDGAWKSSDAGSNFQIRKLGDVLAVYADDGITAGSAITWDIKFAIPFNGGFSSSVDTATTNAVVTHSSFNMKSTGTAAANFGQALFFNVDTDSQLRTAGQLNTLWATAADATRKGRVVWHAYDTAARECIRFEASGTAAMIGFFATAAAVKQTVTGSRGGNAALASLLTALATYGLITNSSSA